VAPSELARVDQFQIDRSKVKNPDYCRFCRTPLDAVEMRGVSDAPDKAAIHGSRDAGLSA
jgi:hypothetical protein